MEKLRDKPNDDLVTRERKQPTSNIFSIAPDGENMFAVQYNNQTWGRIMYQEGVFNLVYALLMKKFVILVNEAQIYEGYQMRDDIRIPRARPLRSRSLDWVSMNLPPLYVQHQSRTLQISGWQYGFWTASYHAPGVAPYSRMKEGFKLLLEYQLAQYFSD